MLERRIRETGFGFLPTRNDWRIGARNYLYFLPVGVSLGFLLKAGHLVKPSDPLKLTALLPRPSCLCSRSPRSSSSAACSSSGSKTGPGAGRTALILTSILFGGVHLWFRHFPNWQWVIIAGTLGWFCGRARNQAGSIRAAMVTHTLVITTWRAFFAA